MKKTILVVICLIGATTSCISLGTYQRNMRKSSEKEKALTDQIAALQDRIKKLEQDIQSKDTMLSSVQETYDNLINDLKQDISDGSVGVQATGDNLTITVGDAVLFRSGSADLQVKGQNILLKVSNNLKEIKDRFIRIDGHTDNIPISGTLKSRYPSNWELSSARAASVARYLEGLNGIDPNLLMVAAFADTKPLGDNATSQGRALNRRVEITLIPNHAPTTESAPPPSE